MERLAFLEQERQAGRERKAAMEAALEEAFQCGRPRLVVNCSFDGSMDVRELTSLAKQVQLAYTQAPVGLARVSGGGASRKPRNGPSSPHFY